MKAQTVDNAPLRVQPVADRRPERTVWKDRRWEWAELRPENGTFGAANSTDTYARQKWLYQARIESPSMFSREPGAGLLCWRGTHDKDGACLDGALAYTLSIPQPVPAKLFWSVTVYDALTRSEIATDQNKAALHSLLELKALEHRKTTELYFGPRAPKRKEDQWIKTIPGTGWFVYFRIYGPGQPAFDGTWKPGDFERVK